MGRYLMANVILWFDSLLRIKLSKLYLKKKKVPQRVLGDLLMIIIIYFHNYCYHSLVFVCFIYCQTYAYPLSPLSSL